MKNRLKEIRENKKLSYRDLATKTNNDASDISKFEKEKIDLSLKKICDIADYLECSLDYMLNRTNKDYMQSNPPDELNILIGKLNKDECEKITMLVVEMLEENEKIKEAKDVS